MIVLDSNQLRFVLPGRPALGLLQAVARRAGHTLATTDIVVAEVVRQHQENLNSALHALNTAQQEVAWLMPSESGFQGGFSGIETGKARGALIRREVSRFEESLRATFRVLDTAPEDALEALLREAGHLVPCEEGTGARDATIWITAQRAAESSEEPPLILVSKDKDLNRLNDRWFRPTINLEPTVVDALGHLGFPQVSIPAKQVVERQAFRHALITAIANSTALPPNYLQKIDQAHEVRVRHNGRKYQQCQGDGVTLTSASGPWLVHVVREWVSNPRRHGPPAWKGFRVKVSGTALIVDSQGQDPDIEFSPLVLAFR